MSVPPTDSQFTHHRRYSRLASDDEVAYIFGRPTKNVKFNVIIIKSVRSNAYYCRLEVAKIQAP